MKRRMGGQQQDERELSHAAVSNKIGSLSRRRAQGLGRRKRCPSSCVMQAPARSRSAPSMGRLRPADSTSLPECVVQNSIPNSGTRCPLRFRRRNEQVCSRDVQFRTGFQIPVTGVPAKHGIYGLLKPQCGSVLSVCRSSRETTASNEGCSGGTT